MALHTKKDFGLMCGLKTKDLSVYIRRGKVNLTGEYINDTDIVNANFLEKFKERRANPVEKVKKEPVKEKVKEVSEEKVKELEEKTENTSEKTRENLSITAIEREKKIADLIKVEADTTYRELQIQKLQGQSIPTDLVKDLIFQQSKSLISSFKDGADSFLIEISKRKNLGIVDQAQLKGELIKIINSSSSKAISDCKKNMKIILANYSNQRGVGEHD